MTIAARLAELGITLPETAKPLAIYQPAVRSGELIFVSGQLPTREGAVVHPGRLGDGVTVEQAKEAAGVAALNALAAVHDLVGSLEGLKVVRLVGYVACTPEFDQHPAVVNGASELLRDIFGEELGVGVRLALGVASLPARAAVEIEVLFEIEE
ncbi:MAG: RidA family protein [Dehalococcoidia bacterium]